MTDITLNPSCSEYVNHILLRQNEIDIVKRILGELSISNEDTEHILEHFGVNTRPNNSDVFPITGEGISFIERSIVFYYELIKTKVLELRNGTTTEAQLMEEVKVVKKWLDDVKLPLEE